MVPFYGFVLYLLFLGGCRLSSPAVAFREIDFSADVCFGTCPQFNMTIDETGAATYEAGMFSPREGKFAAIIKPAQLDSLKQLISNAAINSLQDSYTTPVTDHPSYRIQVTFTDGTIKTIDDYGPSGPAALQQLYDFIFSLRETQNWK